MRREYCIVYVGKEIYKRIDVDVDVVRELIIYELVLGNLRKSELHMEAKQLHFALQRGVKSSQKKKSQLIN